MSLSKRNLQTGGTFVGRIVSVNGIEHVVEVFQKMPEAISARLPLGVLIAEINFASHLGYARMGHIALEKYAL